MKNLEVVVACLVFLGIGLALYLGGPEEPDLFLFGDELALAQELPPLIAPGGDLELRGELRSVEGRPVADAFLVLLQLGDDAEESEPLYHAYSDEKGHFVFHHLTPGPYRAVLTHPSVPPKDFEVQLPTGSPVVWELAPALPPLPTLPDLRFTAVQGQLRRPAGLASRAEGLGGFEVVFRPASEELLFDAASERRTRTDAEGRFVIDDLVVARYSVEVLPPWAVGGSWPIVGKGEWGLSEGANDSLELTLEVGALEGVLQEAEGRALVGALIEMTALEARDTVGDPQRWPPGVTDAEGSYQVDLLPPGRYRLHLRAGSASRDLEIVVESGRLTRLPLTTMDPRGDGGAPGG